MNMDKSESITITAVEVERCSKLGTLRLQQGFPEKALEAYKSAYKNAQSLSSHGYMLRACAFNLGALLISTGNYYEGLAYLNKAIPPVGKRDGQSNGDLYFNYGLGYEGLKNVAKAKQYFELALEQYRVEKNYKMEIDTINRASKLCLESDLLLEADEWIKQLILLYSNSNKVQEELQSRVDRSNLLLKVGKAQEAEEVADECFRILEGTTPSTKFAKVYIDLSLAYTQILQYDKAVQCSMKALPLVETPTVDLCLASVLYQNIGAIHNFMGQYKEAVKYHEKACNTYGKLHMRVKQGHCFTNMGFAYSQMKNMDKAKEYYLHGLQAARDFDDIRSQLQNLEGLASVAFHQKSLKKAEHYYQEAVSTFAKSSDVKDPLIHERLISKLRYVIQAQNPKPKQAPKEDAVMLATNSSTTHPENVKYEDLKSIASIMESGNIKVIRKGNSVRYLKVRRSGTRMKFKKIALGLDVQENVEREKKDQYGRMKESDSEDESTDENSDNSESEDNDDSQYETEKIRTSQKEEETKRKRPPDSYLPKDSNHYQEISDGENNGSVEQLETDEEMSDDDETEVKRVMQGYLSEDDVNENKRSTKQIVKADVHDQPNSVSSSSESESDSETDEKQKRSRLKPPVPEHSPTTTVEKSLRTYETPAENSEQIYKNMDQKHPTGSRAQDDENEASGIYESIRPKTKQSEPINDSDEDESSEGEMQKLSRAEKDVMMYKEFQSANKENREKEEAVSEVGDQKNSKNCIVM